MINDSGNLFFNGKLKSVIDSFSNLKEFFEKLFVIIECLGMERNSKELPIPSSKMVNN